MSVLDAMPSSNLKPENEGTRGRRGARGQGQELPMTPPPPPRCHLLCCARSPLTLPSVAAHPPTHR